MPMKKRTTTKTRLMPFTKRQREEARFMLSQIKPLDEWLATTGHINLDRIRSEFGDPVAFCNRFVGQLTKIASGKGARGLVMVTQNSEETVKWAKSKI